MALMQSVIDAQRQAVRDWNTRAELAAQLGRVAQSCGHQEMTVSYAVLATRAFETAQLENEMLAATLSAMTQVLTEET